MASDVGAGPEGWFDGLTSALGQVVATVWQDYPFALPLLLWGVAGTLRMLGWHRWLWPAATASVQSLTQSLDLKSSFPSQGAQRRLRLLLGAEPYPKRAMQVTEAAMEAWFGKALFSPEAAERMVFVAFFYPLAFLALVWVFTGNGKLGAASVLPSDLPGLWRGVALVAVGLWLLTVWWSARWAERTLLGRQKELAWIGIAFVATVVAAVGISAVADAGAGDDVGAFGGSLAFAGGFAVAAAFAVAGAGAGAQMLAGFGAFPVACACAYPIAHAGAFALAGPGATAVALSFGATFCVGVAAVLLLNRVKSRWTGSTLGQALYFLLLAAAPALFAFMGPLLASADYLSATRKAFFLLFFMSLLPLWNAVLDALSIGCTRLFLRRYIARGTGWLWMVVLDLVLALVFTAVLFWGVLALMQALQALGWGKDAGALVAGFREDPMAPEFNWILWMALTNVLPTLVHLCLASAGLWSGWLLRDAALAQGLKQERVRSSKLVAANGQPLASAPVGNSGLMLQEPLVPAQAEKLVNWVYVDFWLAAALPWCLVLALWPVWKKLMHSLLHFLPT